MYEIVLTREAQKDYQKLAKSITRRVNQFDIDGEPHSPLPNLGADELLLVLNEQFGLPLILAGQ